MELRQLKYFVSAAEHLNFTKAADHLCITQSTLSHQIKELENSLDSLLFDRVGKRVILTEAGITFFHYAKKTLQQAAESKQALVDLKEVRAGNLCIGATYGLTALLIETINTFNQEYPGIKLQIIFGSTTDLLKKLEEFEIDCMLSFLPVSNPYKSIITSRLFAAQLSLILHRSHNWSKLKRISLQKISALPLALPSPSYSIRNFLDDVLHKSALELHATIEINDIHSLLELANTKKWNTILMNSSLFDFDDLKAIPIKGKNMTREATITVAAEIYQKKALLAFQEILLHKSMYYNR
ncbi:LysR substrate-binding domain-containing protein [Robertkochia solimangrovi]|uniref:LysR substrate-binding domain-containing protein n=1 Tax=Robertkochia solimangrovi TaxID=2213046 RepID=UPI00117DF386|nr:LysR substrate-binding domain-containing protein [Robertkochia solimangrovi]TRZ42942.1 LysR family transcriptional regulator [Robertkochia solimangrovi]